MNNKSESQVLAMSRKLTLERRHKLGSNKSIIIVKVVINQTARCTSEENC